LIFDCIALNEPSQFERELDEQEQLIYANKNTLFVVLSADVVAQQVILSASMTACSAFLRALASVSPLPPVTLRSVLPLGNLLGPGRPVILYGV
jgi:hypothetical protein